MTKITYIPGEIANAAVDEHGNRKPVTRTQHIFDDAKGKSQAEVNKDVDDTLALHQSEINAFNNQNYVTVDSFNALPASGSADTVYRVSNWDGTQVDETCYSEYAWNGSAYVHLSTKTQIGEVFDISAYHATGGTLATYADLSAALDSNNGGGVPQSLQKGGMSVKYVRTYDNNYVQFRCKNQLFSANPKDWAFDGDETLVENPEWVTVFTDKEDKILFGVKEDGNFYFGAGCPPQVKQYISEILGNYSSTDYADVMTFLGNLIDGDTLSTLLNAKVDKVTGKSLIDAEYASLQETKINPEWIQVTIDNEDKILEGISNEGKKVQNLPIVTPVKEMSCVDNPEWIEVKTDKEGKIIEGIKSDGTKYISVLKVKEDKTNHNLTEEDVYNGEVYGGNKLVSMKSLQQSNVVLFPKAELGAVCIRFADSPEQDNQVVELFDEYHAKCGFSVVASTQILSDRGAKYAEWNKRGYSINNHSLDFDRNFTYQYFASYNACKEVILLAKKRLEDCGMKVYSVACPAGELATDFKPIMEIAGAYAFTTRRVNPLASRTDNPCDLDSYGMHNHCLQDVKDMIDSAVSGNKFLCLYSHAGDFGTTYSGTYNGQSWSEEWNINKAEQILQYVLSKKNNGDIYFDSPDNVIKYFFNL